MGKLHSYIEESGQKAEGIPFVAYHGEVTTDSDGPAETCVLFTGSLEPKDDMHIRVAPAHKEAYVCINKAQVVFPGILEAYDAVSKHVKETGKTPSGSCREVYFADWSTIGDDESACDIAFSFVD